MLADVIACLACPHCGLGLVLSGPSLRCDAGHAFDIARQGYVSLLPGDAHTGSADTAEMVRARQELLEDGHFAAVAEALAARAASLVAPDEDGCVVDVGAGTGYYLRAVLRRLPHAVGLALDLSKHAARRAARADDRIGAVVCDAWQRLPVRESAVALALSVFAPRNAGELWRVLRPGGGLLVVTPTQSHLAELRTPLGLLDVDQDKPRRLAAQLERHFVREQQDEVRADLQLTPADAQRVVMMGPNAWHRDAAGIAAALEQLGEPVAVTLSVHVGVYRRRDVVGGLAGSAS